MRLRDELGNDRLPPDWRRGGSTSHGTRPEKGLSGKGNRDSKRVLRPDLEPQCGPDHWVAVEPRRFAI